MLEVFSIGGGEYIVNVLNAVAVLAGGGGFRSMLQVMMVMGLTYILVVVAFSLDWRQWMRWFMGATLMYGALVVPTVDVKVTDRINPSLAPAVVPNVPVGLAAVAGLFLVPSFSIVRQALVHAAPEQHRTSMLAIDSVVVELSFMIGPVIGVVLATYTSTPWALLGCEMASALGGILMWLMNPPLRAPDDETSTAAAADTSRSWLDPAVAAVLVAAPLAVPAAGAGAPVPTIPGVAAPRASSDVLPVWLAPVAPHAENPTNPLANRLWGVYRGPQDQVWRPYTRSTGRTREALAMIAGASPTPPRTSSRCCCWPRSASHCWRR